VPAEAYRGLPADQDIPQDKAAHLEIAAYLAETKTTSRWDESQAIAAARAILDKHLAARQRR
jgi:hypothetical protein